MQKNEDNVYDQHLLEVELQKQGIRTVRRILFEQLSCQLSTGDNQRLLLQDVGAVDGVSKSWLSVFRLLGSRTQRIGLPSHTLSQTRLFMEHHVAMNVRLSANS